MSTIEITREHDLSTEDCALALDDLEEYLEGLGARVHRGSERLEFQGRGFDGQVTVRPGLASGRIRLGLLARPFRHQLETEINRHLDARLGAR